MIWNGVIGSVERRLYEALPVCRPLDGVQLHRSAVNSFVSLSTHDEPTWCTWKWARICVGFIVRRKLASPDSAVRQRTKEGVS